MCIWKGILVYVPFVEKKKEQTVEAEYVLCAVGRCPNTDGLFAEGAAPDMERGRVLVNDKFETVFGSLCDR